MIPYGYRIKLGQPVIEESEADRIRALFNLYLSGLPIKDAGLAAGIPLSASAVDKILSNAIYTGLGFYPEIVPPTVFEKTQRPREKKNRNAGSVRPPIMTPTAIKMAFRYDGIDPSITADTKYDAVYQSIRQGDDVRADGKTRFLLTGALHQR